MEPPSGPDAPKHTVPSLRKCRYLLEIDPERIDWFSDHRPSSPGKLSVRADARPGLQAFKNVEHDNHAHDEERPR